jgi:hypothetical protein
VWAARRVFFALLQKELAAKDAKNAKEDAKG